MRHAILLSFLLIHTSALAGPELHVVEHEPPVAKTAVPRSTTISITFDGPVGPSDAQSAPIRVFTSRGALVPCTFESEGPNTITITPDVLLPAGTQMTVHVPAGLVNEGGQSISRAYQWSFWTESTQTGLHFQTDLIHAGHQPFALATGDYDENGSLDLVVIEGGALDQCVLFLNDGSGHFTETLRLGIANSPVHAVSADFDLDGHLDLAVGHWSTQAVSVLLGDGAGGFADPVVYPLGASSHKLAAGDLDGDGYPEILSANRLEGNLSILRNAGDGSFTVDSPVTVGSGTRDVTLGDWDGDGDLDVIVAAVTEGFGIHLNDGEGGFLWFDQSVASLPNPSGGAAYAVCLLSQPLGGSSGLLLYGFGEGTPSYLSTNFTKDRDRDRLLDMGDRADYPFITDIDGDMTLDLVYVDYSNGRLMVARDVASWPEYPNFFTVDRNAPPTSALGDIRNPLAADFDGDGDNDFVTAYRAGGEVHLWRNGSPDDAPPSAWHRMEVQPPLGHYAELRSRIEIADDGTIHCLYRTYIPFEYDENLVHSVFRNGVWTNTDLGILQNNNPPSSMANFWTRLDPSGTLHLAWLGSWAPREAWYATWKNGVWTQEQLPVVGPMTMVRSPGYPPLVFVARGDSIHSMERIADEWVVDLVAVGIRGDQLAADRSADGTPYLAIATIDTSFPIGAHKGLRVGSKVADRWDFEVVDGGLWALNGLRISPTQGPIASYTREAVGYAEYLHTRLTSFNGSQWTTEYAERWIYMGGRECPSAFGVDPSGRPWLVGYEDAFVRGDDHWDHVPLEGKHMFGDISFDADGHPWISNTENRKLAIYTTSSRDIVTAVDPGGDAPESRRVTLGDAIPNPFNPRTTINYSLPVAGHVELEIYDLAGRHVRTLVRAQVNAGTHEVTWSGKDDAGAQVASGVYLYQLRAGEYLQTKRMVLLK